MKELERKVRRRLKKSEETAKLHKMLDSLTIAIINGDRKEISRHQKAVLGYYGINRKGNHYYEKGEKNDV